MGASHPPPPSCARTLNPWKKIEIDFIFSTSNKNPTKMSVRITLTPEQQEVLSSLSTKERNTFVATVFEKVLDGKKDSKKEAEKAKKEAEKAKKEAEKAKKAKEVAAKKEEKKKEQAEKAAKKKAEKALETAKKRADKMVETAGKKMQAAIEKAQKSVEKAQLALLKA